jgi:hypothetical protein
VVNQKAAMEAASSRARRFDMQNKPKSRTDIQWVISSLSLAVTLGLWGLFASHEKKAAGVEAQVIVPPQSTEETVVVSQPPQLLPGQKLLFGGTAPQQSQIIVQTKSRGRGGGGGGSASTGSSHP